MYFEEGQRIRSKRTFDLDGCPVDGSVVFAEDWDDVPSIRYNDEYEILSLAGGFATLRNLSECAWWDTCEIDQSDLADFELCY